LWLWTERGGGEKRDNGKKITLQMTVQVLAGGGGGLKNQRGKQTGGRVRPLSTIKKQKQGGGIRLQARKETSVGCKEW